MAQKASYGIDAPGVIRNLLLAAVAGIFVALLAPPEVALGPIQIDFRGFAWTTAVPRAAMGPLPLRRIAPEGHATGIDIWNTDDLSGNALERTQRNPALENVAAGCTPVTEAAQAMSFVDESFDVNVSDPCLHNIDDEAARRQACGEIARVLRPGGVAIISDYKLTGEYARTLQSAGLAVKDAAPNFRTTFPPLRIVTARKA